MPGPTGASPSFRIALAGNGRVRWIVTGIRSDILVRQSNGSLAAFITLVYVVIVAGIGSFRGQSVAFVGHQKGRDLKQRTHRNFGMPSPGHTVLRTQGNGTWSVDSFFDMFCESYARVPGDHLRGEPHDQHASIVVAESRNRLAPVFPIEVSAPFFTRNALAISAVVRPPRSRSVSATPRGQRTNGAAVPNTRTRPCVKAMPARRSGARARA